MNCCQYPMYRCTVDLSLSILKGRLSALVASELLSQKGIRLQFLSLQSVMLDTHLFSSRCILCHTKCNWPLSFPGFWLLFHMMAMSLAANSLAYPVRLIHGVLSTICCSVPTSP